jgi:membrane protease YdiL (CAAX protease family)
MTTPSPEASATPDAPTLPQSIIVELGLGIIGVILILVTGRSFADAYRVDVAPLAAVAVGVAIGAGLGGLFGFGVTRPAFADRVRPFLRQFTSAPPNPLNFAILGLAAAVGEETLFRAAVQPVGGIVIASILFMLAHSLIADFRHPTPGKVAYALLAFSMGLVLGVLYDRVGIAASMGAHFAFDTVALLLIRPLLPVARSVAPAAA